jgi:hypothetical protein
VSAVELLTSANDGGEGKLTDRDVHKTLVLGHIADFRCASRIQDVSLVYFFKVFVRLGITHIRRKSTFEKERKKNVHVYAIQTIFGSRNKDDVKLGITKGVLPTTRT